MAQLQVFVVEHDSITSSYNSFGAAIAAADTGDVIYLPGGNISYTSSITKSVALIGAGYNIGYTNATQPTTFTSDITFNSADNLYLTGINFSQELYLYNCNNVSVERCRIGSSSSNSDELYVYSCNNVFIKECVVLDMNGTSDPIVFENSILYFSNLYSNTIRNATIKNSVIHSYRGSSDVIWMVNGSVNNSIITGSNNTFINQGSGVNYSNCVFSSDSVALNSATFANISLVPNDSLFEGISSNTNYIYGDDYHLKANSPAKGAGANGGDPGIYGGTQPFKEGGLPFNPHIIQINVPSTTDQNGNLQIEATVEAQNR